MPLYDFHCDECDHTVEVLLRRYQIAEAEEDAPCPECEGTLRRKLGGRVAVVFKGSGWAKDGYSASGATPSPSTD